MAKKGPLNSSLTGTVVEPTSNPQMETETRWATAKGTVANFHKELANQSCPEKIWKELERPYL